MLTFTNIYIYILRQNDDTEVTVTFKETVLKEYMHGLEEVVQNKKKMKLEIMMMLIMLMLMLMLIMVVTSEEVRVV